MYCDLRTVYTGMVCFIRRNWNDYAEDPDREIGSFLEWGIDQVGARKDSAHGHFRHAGLSIEKIDS
jgi:hypothetical protein